jgi:hypothetical protein
MLYSVARRSEVGAVAYARVDPTDTSSVRSAVWIDYRRRVLRNQTLPTPGVAIGHRAYMYRCVEQTVYRYAVPGIAEPDDPHDLGRWVREGRDTVNCPGLADAPTNGTPVDGILTGGLSVSQAKAWITSLAGYTEAGKPIFTFSGARPATVGGRKTVQVDFTIRTASSRSSMTSGFLGAELHKLAGTDFPYNPMGAPIDGFAGTYWIDPVSHLPVRSVGHVVRSSVVGDGGIGERYETSYQFSEPDWNALPVK